MKDRENLSKIEKIAGAGAILGLFMVTLGHSETMKHIGLAVNTLPTLYYGYRAGYFWPLLSPSHKENYAHESQNKI